MKQREREIERRTDNGSERGERERMRERFRALRWKKEVKQLDILCV